MNTRKLTLTFLIIAREAFDSLSNGAPHSDGHQPAAFDFGGKDILSKVSSELDIKEGADMKFGFKENKVHLFDSWTEKTIF